MPAAEELFEDFSSRCMQMLMTVLTAAAPRLFVDVLTPEQLDVIADAAEAVPAQLDRESAAA